MRRQSLALLLAGIVGLSPACSAVAGSMQPVTIQASHPRAEIYVDGQLVGTGATTVSLKRNRSHAVMARLGDATATAHIGKSISTTGVLDIVGGFFFLVPFIGVVTPGFWELDQDMVSLSLPVTQIPTEYAPRPVVQQAVPNSPPSAETFDAWASRQPQPSATPGGGR